MFINWQNKKSCLKNLLILLHNNINTFTKEKESQLMGEKIKQLRKRFNMTQQQLADALNVQKGTVSMWELGKRTPDVATVIKLADAFKVDILEIIGTKHNPVITPVQENCINIIKTLSDIPLIKAEAYLSALKDLSC